MKYYLGVDAGGTKTKAVLIDESSQILGEVNGGPANYHNVGIVEAITNVEATIGQLLEKTNKSMTDITWATIGIASCDTPKDHAALLEAFSKGALNTISQRLTVINDAKIGLYCGTLPPGIVVVCGTGSNVYGINDHDDEASAGNWGYFLGDKGSGYILGKRMFEAVVEVYDGVREGPTKLTEAVEKRLSVKSSADINDWYSSTKPSVHEISDFAIPVLQAAEEGDVLARDLVDKSIKDLGKSLLAVVKKLKMEDDAVRIVIAGGLFESKYFRALFEGHATALIKRVRIIKPLVPMAVGAALHAKNTAVKK